MYSWQVKIKRIFYFLLLLGLVTSGYTRDRIVIGGMNGLDPRQPKEEYSVLLALSGGGARGLAIVGILKAFEEKNIRIDAVAGTSIGGIIGGLLAVGYSPYQIDSITAEINFNNLFSNSPPRRSMFFTQRQERDRHLLSIRFNNFRPMIPQALTTGQQLTFLLTELTTRANYKCDSDFKKLPIPFMAICTDIISGERVIMDQGSIADAMRATMAFPLAFTGVEDEGRLLMDGGLVTPIPVELVRTLSDSIDFVVAVNTTSKLSPKEDLKTPVDIADQVTTIMSSDQLEIELAKADFIINPDIDNFKSTDFRFRDSLVEIGYQNGLEAADQIITRLKSKNDDTQYFISEIDLSAVPDSTGFVSLLNKSYNKEELIAHLKELTLNNNLFEMTAIIEAISNNSDSNEIRLVISGSSNFLFDDVKIIFQGNTIFDDITLARQFLSDDSIMTPVIIQNGMVNITDLYKEQGYDLVNIKNIDIISSEKKIIIFLDEAIIRRVDVENNERTRDWYVRSYFPLKTGQPYSTSQAALGIQNIYGTNLFDRVTVDAVPSENGVLVKIRVEEKTFSQIRLGWHWDDEYESEEFIEYLDDNVAGIGLEYLIHARYSPGRQNYYLLMKTDRIFSTYLTSRIHLYHNRLDRNMFSLDGDEVGIRDEVKSGFNFSLGQQIARLGTVTVDLIIEEVEYTDSLLTNVEETNEFGLRIIDLKSIVESFNRIPFPEKGNRHLFQIQVAGKYLGGDVEFTRIFTEHEMYIPLGKYLNYHPKLSVGVSRSGLPPTEQFYLGGYHSFSGFRTFQLAGDKMFQFSNELRFKLPFSSYISIKYDLGEVYNHTDQIKIRNLRHGFGTALMIDAPIGPIEAGYGIADKDFENVYINIGLKF